MHQEQWGRVARDIQFNLEIDLVSFSKLVPKEASVLDFGCGYGRILRLLNQHGYGETVGVDSSEKFIERGNKESPELNLVLYDGGILPFLSNTFTAITCVAVFTCITEFLERNNCITELYRVLKPGGIIHMVEFCSETPKEFVSGFGVPMLYSTNDELGRLLRKFHIISESVRPVRTISGTHVNSYVAFARKI